MRRVGPIQPRGGLTGEVMSYVVTLQVSQVIKEANLAKNKQLCKVYAEQPL